MARLPLACVALLAAYFPAALWLRTSYVDQKPKGEVVVQLLPPFTRQGFAAIKHDLYGLPAELIGDREDVKNDSRSPVTIYENLKPLGPAHNTFRVIANIGMGRFSHWQHQGLVFSASDNSDPNTNGRRYWAVVPTAQPQASAVR